MAYFCIFGPKKVIFKHHPPPPVYIGQKLTIREKMAYFCILGWKKKIGATYDQAIYKVKN